MSEWLKLLIRKRLFEKKKKPLYYPGTGQETRVLTSTITPWA